MIREKKNKKKKGAWQSTRCKVKKKKAPKVKKEKKKITENKK